MYSCFRFHWNAQKWWWGCKNAQKLRANYYDIFCHGSIAFNGTRTVWVCECVCVVSKTRFWLFVIARRTLDENSFYAGCIVFIDNNAIEGSSNCYGNSISCKIFIESIWIFNGTCQWMVRIAITLLVYEHQVRGRTPYFCMIEWKGASMTSTHNNPKYKINCGKENSGLVSTPLLVINAFPYIISSVHFFFSFSF